MRQTDSTPKRKPRPALAGDIVGDVAVWRTPPPRPVEATPNAAPKADERDHGLRGGEQSERPTSGARPSGAGATGADGASWARDDAPAGSAFTYARAAAIEHGRGRSPAELARAVASARQELHTGRARGYAREVWSRFVALHGAAYAPETLDALAREHAEGAAERAAELEERAGHASGALVATRISERDVTGPTGPDGRALRVADYVARCPRSQFASRWPPLILWTWDRGSPDTARRQVATCGSWRCDGCAPKAASVAFARMREAFAPYDARDVVFAVLTLDQRGRYSGSAWPDVDTAYRELSRLTRNWLARINRWCEARGIEGPGSRWVATVECHRSGWPHLNLVMVAPGLAELCEENREAALALGATQLQATLVFGELLDHTTGAGWGPRSTMERARSADALAGYITKLAKLHDATVGEVAKLTQRPDVATKGFRRIRSGKGFLPPRRSSGLTGALIQSWGAPQGVSVRLYGRPSKLDRECIERWATRTAETDVIVTKEASFLREQGELSKADVVLRHALGQATSGDRRKLHDERKLVAAESSRAPPKVASA